MAVIPVDFAQVNMKFTGSAVPSGAEITFGVFPSTVQTLQQVATNVEAAWNASNMDTVQTDEITLSSIGVKFGPNATGASGEFPFNRPGTNTGAAVPPNTSVLYRKGTGFGGRAGRGRFYVPAMPEVNVDQSGDIIAAAHSSYQNAGTAFLSELSSRNLLMVVLHGAGSPLSAPTTVLSLLPAVRVATQRRRLRR